MAVMEEDDIEVAVGTQRASPEAPDGKKCQVAAAFPNRTIGQAGEPFVRFGGVGPAECITLEFGSGEQSAAPFPE
jgi:hypothetical protein